MHARSWNGRDKEVCYENWIHMHRHCTKIGGGQKKAWQKLKKLHDGIMIRLASMIFCNGRDILARFNKRSILKYIYLQTNVGLVDATNSQVTRPYFYYASSFTKITQKTKKSLKDARRLACTNTTRKKKEEGKRSGVDVVKKSTNQRSENFSFDKRRRQ